MPEVGFLRGVNIGGHKTFRPTTLAAQLQHLDAVNIGAAGAFVIRRPRSAPKLPIVLPASGKRLLKVVGRDGRFVIGIHRRQMKAVSLLGKLDRLFGTAVTTRNWNTITAIAPPANQTVVIMHLA